MSSNNRISSKLAREALGCGAITDIWRCYDRYLELGNTEDLINIHIDSSGGLATIRFLDNGYSYGLKSIYETSNDICIVNLGDTEVIMLKSEIPA